MTTTSTTMTGPGLSSRQVMEATGLTYRQLDYWDRSGIVSPSLGKANGSGSNRLWSETDVRHLRIVGVMMSLGRKSDNLTLDRDAVAKVIELADDPRGCRWIVVSGAYVGLCPAGELEQRAAGGATVIDLEAVPA